MQRASTTRAAAPRTSSSPRDVLAILVPSADERERLRKLTRQVLRGRGSRRQKAERTLRTRVRGGVAPLVAVVLAVRDELMRETPPPRGLAGRVDALLLALAQEEAVFPPDPEKARPAPGSSARSGALLKHLLDLVPDAVLTLRESGRPGLWNRAGVGITGRRRRDLVRDGARTLFRQPEEFDALLAELETRGKAEPRETLLAREDAEDVPVRVFAAPLALDEGGRADPERYLLFLHDLTEVHRIRRRLIETEKLSTMAKIAGSVAHEFRNPLNSLFLSADLLEDELEGTGAPEEAIAPTLTAIREEVERLNQIINHYLSLSKVQTSTPEIVDLGRVVEEFATSWSERAEEPRAELRVRVHDGDRSVSADLEQVRRVLVNLVENALDALEEREEGSPERSKPGIVTLAVRPMRRTVKLTVRDNGPGIPDDQRDKVFEPFFTSKSRGSGLGLYLVREIVLAHGGGIALAGTGGRGTAVVMHWPRPNGDGE